MSLSEYWTVPMQVVCLSVDVVPFTVDATALLASGETVTGITTKLTNLVTGTAVTLTSSPTFTATSATQQISGSELSVGARFRLMWAFGLSSGVELGQVTIVDCPA